MADIYSSISTAISIGKRLAEINKKIEHAEFARLLADLNLELAETKNRLSGLVMENSDLKEQVHAISQVREAEQMFVNFKGVSFRRKPSGGFEDAAYCPSCRIGMAPLEPDEPLLCGKCNAFSGFNSGKLKDVMEELLLEYGES